MPDGASVHLPALIQDELAIPASRVRQMIAAGRVWFEGLPLSAGEHDAQIAEGRTVLVYGDERTITVRTMP